jgi:fused signal recognition particle receptor
MGLFSKLVSKFSSLTGTPSSETLADFEAELLKADLGPALTKEVMELARKGRGDLKERIESTLLAGMSEASREIAVEVAPVTILVIGVNGTGKTTTVAKLGYRFHQEGKKVLLTAADTFRAAAVDQLHTWADRIGVSFHSGADRADPAAVAFDGAKRAKEEGFDIHLIDTAGRLHTENNLMAELTKVRRVIEKVAPVHETLLVLDATTGQNAIVQAREFMAATPVTGIILTKMDGSARGGAILAVERELQLPIKFVGVGESVNDLKAFDPQEFVASLF